VINKNFGPISHRLATLHPVHIIIIIIIILNLISYPSKEWLKTKKVKSKTNSWMARGLNTWESCRGG